MIRPIAMDVRDRFRLWLRFSDGVEGVVDLSSLAGKGVFAAWLAPGVFENARIDEFGALAWGEGLDLCPDSLYEKLTGHLPDARNEARGPIIARA